jgi:hypothetical protein
MYKDKILALEKDKQDLMLNNKELEFNLKQQRVLLETEKLEIISKLQKLESDKLATEQALKSYENDKKHQQDLQKFQYDLKIEENRRQADLQREEARNEVLRIRQERDKAVTELKGIYDRELDALKAHLYTLQEKIRHQTQKIESLKENNNSKFLQIRIEELENELDYYKASKPMLYNEKDHEYEFNSSQEDFSNLKHHKSYTKPLQKTNTDYELEHLTLQNDRLKLQLDRTHLELQQLSTELEKTRKEQQENENNLKNEIKFLIGKLLKAKSKLSAEGELSETIRKESMLSTLRYRSGSRSRVMSRNSPTKENEEY